MTQPNPPEKVEGLVERLRSWAALLDNANRASDLPLEAAARITALEAQVAGMGEALEAIETEAEREAVRWPHLKRVILIAARKARLAAAKEPS